MILVTDRAIFILLISWFLSVWNPWDRDYLFLDHLVSPQSLQVNNLSRDNCKAESCSLTLTSTWVLTGTFWSNIDWSKWQHHMQLSGALNRKQICGLSPPSIQPSIHPSIHFLSFSIHSTRHLMNYHLMYIHSEVRHSRFVLSVTKY